jgi:hypothetical protein
MTATLPRRHDDGLVILSPNIEAFLSALWRASWAPATGFQVTMSRVPPLRFIEPQLASLVDEPPEGKHWIHEIKHDGYRCQLLIEPDRVRMLRATATIGVTAFRPSSRGTHLGMQVGHTRW